MVRKRRDELKPGDIFRSSRGCDVLVKEVDDSAESRVEHRHVGISGHMHGHPHNQIVTERYEASSTVEVYSLVEFVKKIRDDAVAQLDRGIEALVGGMRPATYIERQFSVAEYDCAWLEALMLWGEDYAEESWTFRGRGVLVETPVTFPSDATRPWSAEHTKTFPTVTTTSGDGAVG